MMRSISAPEKSGQDRDDDHARNRGGEISRSPVGHVVAQQGDLVPVAETGCDERFDQGVYPVCKIAVRERLPAVHRKTLIGTVSVDAVLI